MSKNLKTEHSGAKNGGGHWGPRQEAKSISKKVRRKKDKSEIKKELKDLFDFIISGHMDVFETR